jgi:hypothetical protein
MTSRHVERSIPSPYHTVHGQQHDAVLSGRLIAVATTRGGQQPTVVGGCIEVIYWQITLTLPATVAFKRRVCPLPATEALSCVCALEMCMYLRNAHA